MCHRLSLSCYIIECIKLLVIIHIIVFFTLNLRTILSFDGFFVVDGWLLGSFSFSDYCFFFQFDFALNFCIINYHIIITYYSLYSILVGPIRVGLTFTRVFQARPSRRLGFFRLLLSLFFIFITLLCFTPMPHPWRSYFIFCFVFIVFITWNSVTVLFPYLFMLLRISYGFSHCYSDDITAMIIAFIPPRIPLTMWFKGVEGEG